MPRGVAAGVEQGSEENQVSSKTLIIIVVFGLGALVLLGMSMQFVVKSSPGLQETIRFKQCLAQDFSTRGIQEVALRTLEGGSGHHLLLTGTIPESELDRARLDAEVADYFVRTHGDKRAELLRISYHLPRSWGCSSALAEPHRVEEIRLSPIRRRIARVEKEKVLTVQLEQLGCRLLSCEVFEESTLEMRVKVAVTDPVEVGNLARRIERDTRGRLRGFYSTLRLLLVGEPIAATDEKGAPVVRQNVLFDATYDRRGSPSRPAGRTSPAGSAEGARARTDG